MDGGGRLAQPLKRSSRPHRANAGASRLTFGLQFPVRLTRLFRRQLTPIRDWRLPRGGGIAATTLFVVGSIAYGAIKGEHLPEVAAQLKDARDALANTAGFRITQWSIGGRRQLSEQDVLSVAGIRERTSLL